jgi:predicted 3-demethylubiquinone-9 3-methyltransferase (glyoxalase superfamily)
MSAIAGNPDITPFLWFDTNAEEAVEFYVSIFPNSRRVDELRNPGGGARGPVGSILTLAFELNGKKFVALNGGPDHTFNEAVSFVVNCEKQQEIDYYWERLLEGGGSEIACGWLKDKFGLRWQVTPARIGELLRTPAAMQAMMRMKKFDIAELERAGRG